MARLDEISTTPESGSAVTGATSAYSPAADSLQEPNPPASLTKSTLSPVSLRSLVAGGIIIALAALALDYLRSDDVPAASTATTDIAAPVAAGDRRSIAVLPLVNVGRAAGDEYFSDGMTDELANALSRMPGLRVASRTSAFAFKGAKGDAREIGRRLNVGTLLEGTVRRDGSRLRVQVRLTNASDGLSIWGQSYERTIQDVFAVQDSISRAVVDALQI
ncbi:MAG: hypothetical protein M3R07_01180, partial [Gemmatimonadota bacterium]|nr:hypothetical protein [Gemmatimonadota bacterium]